MKNKNPESIVKADLGMRDISRAAKWKILNIVISASK